MDTTRFGCGNDGNIYFPNGIFLLLPFVESVLSYHRQLREQPVAMRTLLVQNLLFVLACLLTFLPTIVTRRIIFGGYFRFGSYSHLSWDWSAPHLREVLFSSDHGLFSWTPILALALLGLFFVPRASKLLALYFGLAVLAYYYVISSTPTGMGCLPSATASLFLLLQFMFSGLRRYCSASDRLLVRRD